MQLISMVLNDWEENTYLLFDEHKNCIIIDPGCNTKEGEHQLSSYIEDKKLKVVALINTHCHIDHVLGNLFVHDIYKVPLQAHRGEEQVLAMAPMVAERYGVHYTPSPPISVFLEEGQQITFGEMTFKVLFTPGHSPASICLYFEKEQLVIGGDVLFKGSIGRTDLPGGDYDTLINSIQSQLFTLPEEIKIYPGHGPYTTIGFEKRNNPFFK